MRAAKHSGIVVLLLGLFVASCSDTENKHPLQGKQWPQLAMSPLYVMADTNTANKSWQLINVWATWCEPCRKEMPMLENLAAVLAEQNFALILLSIDTDLNLVKEFTLSYHIDSRVFIAARDDVEQQLAVLSYPMTFLVDPNGAVVKVYQGAKEWDSAEMISSIKSIIYRPL